MPTVLCVRCKRTYCNLPANVCTMCLLFDSKLREGER